MQQLDGLQFSGKELTEETLLQIVKTEREQSVGLDNDDDLNRNRELALEYYKGLVPDMPVAVDEDGQDVNLNRSKSVSPDLADCVETIMPDLMETLVGDDCVSFLPMSEDDVDATEQETDYLRHVMLERSRGFANAYTWIKESLLCRTGIAHWWWEEAETEEADQDVSLLELQELQMMGVPFDVIETNEETGQARIRVENEIKPASLSWSAIKSNNFAVHPDTETLPTTPYCVMRTTPQIQDLIADGYDEDVVRGLHPADDKSDEELNYARDLDSYYEHENGSMGDLANVEVFVHYLKADFEGVGKPQIWRIVTGSDDSVLLDLEKRPRIEFADLCPFPMMFAFYGQSLADKMMPWQRINTSLLRTALDSNAFQLNQRPVIAMDDATDDTIDDLLNNEPGHPIRIRRQGGLQPFVSTPLTTDPFASIEQVKTMAEQSSGAIRNGMGLNAEALHETKGGMQIQDNNSQKRIRMMARLFAEGGFKELYLGAHECIRTNASASDTAMLRGKWVNIDPSTWKRRSQMRVEIGVGSGGRDADLQARSMFRDIMERILEMQGGASGPLVSMENIYNFAKGFGDRLGLKQVETYISNPAEQPPEQEGVDPEVAAAQAEMQAKQQEFQMKMAMEREKLAMEERLKREQMEAEIVLKREQMAAEMQLKREQMMVQASTSADITPIRPGGAVG